jgi:hypothetical protein
VPQRIGMAIRNNTVDSENDANRTHTAVLDGQLLTPENMAVITDRVMAEWGWFTPGDKEQVEKAVVHWWFTAFLYDKPGATPDLARIMTKRVTQRHIADAQVLRPRLAVACPQQEGR